MDTGTNALDTQRIEHLIGHDLASSRHVTVVGLGSGGFPALMHLAMAGVASFDLFDADLLEAHNLVKHPAGRRDLGRAKVDIAAEWLRDRNPQVRVFAHAVDTRRDEAALAAAVHRSDLVLGCVDNRVSREQLVAVCRRFAKPAVFGQVYRGGFGGEVICYLPRRSGCPECVRILAERGGMLHDPQLPLDGESEHRIYGLGQADYGRSGLSCDLAMVAGAQASMALSELVGVPGARIAPNNFTWLTMATRATDGVVPTPFVNHRHFVPPVAACPNGCCRGAAPDTAEARLGVAPRADADAIAAAARSLRALLHPDRAGGDDALAAVLHEQSVTVASAAAELAEAWPAA